MEKISCGRLTSMAVSGDMMLYSDVPADWSVANTGGSDIAVSLTEENLVPPSDVQGNISDIVVIPAGGAINNVALQTKAIYVMSEGETNISIICGRT